MKPRTLFPLEPATGNLTPRQACALEILQAHPDGLRAIDLGRELHIRLGSTCSCGWGGLAGIVSCRFAHSAGEEVGKALRRKDLAIKRRSGLWVSLVRPAAPPEEWPEDMF